jgi:hypothetical protein
MTDQPEKIKILDFDKFQMWTPTPGAEGKRAKLGFGIRDGNPRITCFTNDPKDTISKGIIYAAMNPETFFAFLTMFEKVIKSTGEVKNKIDCFGMRWENDKPTKDRILISELYFGRTADGIIWISLVAENRPKIKFDFRISDFHGIFHGDGTQITEAESSQLEAMAKLGLLRSVYSNMIAKQIENPTPRPQNTQGNRGNFNKSGDSSANKSTANTVMDDLPFN